MQSSDPRFQDRSTAAEPDIAPRAEPPHHTPQPTRPLEENAAVVAPVSASKADPTKRVVAGVVDALIAIVIGLIPWVGGIVAAAYWLVRDGLDLEFMDRRSIGKKLLKLRPVTLDGSPMDIEKSIRRNWMFAFGGIVSLLLYIPIIGWLLMIPVGLVGLALVVFELIKVLSDDQGRRWGDSLANTKVVELER